MKLRKPFSGSFFNQDDTQDSAYDDKRDGTGIQYQRGKGDIIPSKYLYGNLQIVDDQEKPIIRPNKIVFGHFNR